MAGSTARITAGSTPSMVFAFIIGPVAVTVRYWEERDREVEGGARIEVRRVAEVIGAHHRPGAAGWRIEAIADGGLWRSDILTVISRPGDEVRYHPEFRDGDVGIRVFDPEMTADPVGFTMARLADLPRLLADAGAPQLADQVDPAAVEAILPAVRNAIDVCLARCPRLPRTPDRRIDPWDGTPTAVGKPRRDVARSRTWPAHPP